MGEIADSYLYCVLGVDSDIITGLKVLRLFGFVARIVDWFVPNIAEVLCDSFCICYIEMSC